MFYQNLSIDNQHIRILIRYLIRFWSLWFFTLSDTVYPKKYAHGFCFAVLCCGYTLTDFPISTRLTSLALWQSNDCPSASKATLMNMDKYFMWIHYERLHNHNKAKHNKTVCIFLGIYCTPTATLIVPFHFNAMSRIISALHLEEVVRNATKNTPGKYQSEPLHIYVRLDFVIFSSACIMYPFSQKKICSITVFYMATVDFEIK